MFDTDTLEDLRNYTKMLNEIHPREDSDRWTCALGGIESMMEGILKILPHTGVIGVLTKWDEDSKKKMEDLFASLYVTLIMMYDDAPGMDLTDSINAVASATLAKLKARNLI